MAGNTQPATAGNVVRMPEGYWRLANPPTASELSDYYAQSYYQHSRGNYRAAYTDEEHAYLEQRVSRRRLLVEPLLRPQPGARRMIDIGAGEGWVMKHFREHGWEVAGLDFSEDGMRRHNPELLPSLIQGSFSESFDRLRSEGKRFDLLWLGNVLEHVLEPARLLSDCRSITAPNGALVIEVPNDFSRLQQRLQRDGFIDRPFWIVEPDHVNYFDAASLRTFCEANGWEFRDQLADYPIDWHLFNPDTNYVSDKAKGPGCHQTRVRVENFLASVDPVQANHLFGVLAGLGGGRQITVVLQPEGENRYRALAGDRWDEGDYAIVPFRSQDLLPIKQWRNEQIDVLRQHKPLTDADQRRYYEAAIVPSFSETRPRIILFSFLHRGECIGYGGLTNIDWESSRAELSFIVDTRRATDATLYERDFGAFLTLMDRVGFGALRFDRLFAETFDIRPLHVAVLEKHGYTLEGRMRGHAVVAVGSSRVDLQACKLEYSIVSPK